MFTVDWAIETLYLIVGTFSDIWTFLSTPISEMITDSYIFGPLVSVIIPDAIGDLSPIVLMLGVGVTVYLALQLIAWIQSWVPFA